MDSRNKKIKILAVNTADRGGAANSCFRLHQALRISGVDSKILLKSQQENWPGSFVHVPRSKRLTATEKIQNKLRRLAQELKLLKAKERKNLELDFLVNRTKGLELFSFPTSNFDITDSDLYNEADVINLHWTANFLDYNSFFEQNTKPVVWTLHDMNPFTGGEHYEELYFGIDSVGEPIVRILSKEEKKINKQNLELKRKALEKFSDLTIVAPSDWMANEARKSELFKKRPILTIPYGLDSEIYKPRDKSFSRQLLGIPEGKKTFLFVSESLSNQRKGFIYLKKAFELLNRKDIILCAIGSKNSMSESVGNTIELGFIKDERLMSIAYSAADAFVIPSLMDNLPNTVMESLMCGTPAIGFPIGGIPDMVQDGFNGFLTKKISVSALAETLDKFIENSHLFNRDRIREEALKRYDSRIQANRYFDLFSNIIK